MSFVRTIAVAAGFTMAAFGASAATIDFDSGTKNGGKYFEDGFVFEQLENGAVSVPKGCVDADGVNSHCLLLSNQNSSKVVKMYRDGGGTFDLLSFTFDGRDGESGSLYVSSSLGGTEYLFSEDNVSNIMSPSGPLDQFRDVTMIFFRDASKGSSRVDDIVTNVPLPAAGFLLLAGLGGLALVRKRKS